MGVPGYGVRIAQDRLIEWEGRGGCSACSCPENGPNFVQVSLRATYALPIGGRAKADLIAEAFNLFNRVNYDVNSIQNGEFLSGPTLANPALAAVPVLFDAYQLHLEHDERTLAHLYQAALFGRGGVEHVRRPP